MKGLVVCTEQFKPKLHGNASLFTKGLLPLRDQFGGGLMLYMVNFCPDQSGGNGYLADADAVRSFKDANGHFFITPLANTSEKAYGDLMDEVLID